MLARRDAVGARGFTLVELLVVISIIALLIAMLLPALGKARAVAQQVRCLSQTRQMALGASYYVQDFKDAMPSTPNWVGSGNLWAWDYGLAPNVWGLNSSRSGWHILYHDTDYFVWDALVCPSMDDPNFTAPNLADSRMMHYGYRYNTYDSCATTGLGNPPRYPDQVFDIKGISNKPLFAEAACMRRALDGTGRILKTYAETGWAARRWAHQIGGNMVMHDGSGRFIPNTPFVNDFIKGWPAQYGVRYDYYDKIVTEQ